MHESSVCLTCGHLCKNRLCISTTLAQRVVKALKTRRFSSGSLRPTSGLNSMNLAMSWASIRSILALVPRQRAKAFTCAGGLYNAPSGDKPGSECPFLSAPCFKSDPQGLSEIFKLREKLCMACCGAVQAAPSPALHTKAVGQSWDRSMPITVAAGIISLCFFT